MIAAVAAHGPSPLWYATRGAGATTMVLLTASVVLGIGEERGWRPAKAPRYAVAALHRTISMLALVMLVVHIVTTIADPFPKIGIAAAFIPFATDYRPLWMGLGTVASDLLIALIITSVLRRRLGYRAWRAVHWAAYACWPVAILHGLGTGSDTKATWMLALTLASVAAVVMAVLARLARPGTSPRARIGGTSAATLSVIGLAVWLPGGPLGTGWAKRAGTPASVLTAFKPKVARATARTTVAKTVPDPFGRSFSASFTGPLREGTSAGGLAVVDLNLRLQGQPDGVLRIRLGGAALSGGGLRMDRSAVTLGPPGRPGEYQGKVDFLQNSELRAKVGSPEGHALRLDVSLSIDGSNVQGTVSGKPLA
jgi:methionine sulfoxide reductase heme-binding subunit